MSQIEGIENVLIIEPEAAFRNYLKALFEYKNMRVFAVSDLQKAFKHIEVSLPDFIYLGMKDGESISTCLDSIQRFKNHAVFHSIPLFVGNYSNSRHLFLEAYRMGVQDYLLKPFEPSFLWERMNRLADRRNPSLMVDRLNYKIENGILYFILYGNIGPWLLSDYRTLREKNTELKNTFTDVVVDLHYMRSLEDNSIPYLENFLVQLHGEPRLVAGRLYSSLLGLNLEMNEPEQLFLSYEDLHKYWQWKKME